MATARDDGVTDVHEGNLIAALGALGELTCFDLLDLDDLAL